LALLLRAERLHEFCKPIGWRSRACRALHVRRRSRRDTPRVIEAGAAEIAAAWIRRAGPIRVGPR
jgi:hypothetical protein